MRNRVLLVALIAGCVVLTSCGGVLPGKDSRALTSVHVTRTNAFPQNHVAPYDMTFDVTQTDTAKARDLYQLLASLPPMPKGTYSCPVDLGVVYHLTFLSGKATVTAGTIDASGCGGIELGGTSHWWARDGTFWAQVARDLGVPESALHPVA